MRLRFPAKRIRSRRETKELPSMFHINHNTISQRNRVVVPEFTRNAVRSLYVDARKNSEFHVWHLANALGCLLTHTPFVTATEVDAVNDAIDAVHDGVADRAVAGLALKLVDAAAEPLLDPQRFDPTAWTSEGADAYLRDGGYDVPEAPLGWSWVECVGCGVPLPVPTALHACHRCDECGGGRLMPMRVVA